MRARYSLKPIYIGVLLAFAIQPAAANPIGPSVINGQATFATTGNALTVTNIPGTIINWKGFSIGANEITRFAQQSASSAVLNRVTSSNPSSILGTLQSNGRVFLVNPNGIVFGAGATIDVAGLVASTLNLSNADFLAGRYHFTQVPGAQNISNAGKLTAQQGGQIYLIAPNVDNTGVITAPNGEILLAAGHSVDLVNTTNPNLRVSITAPAGDATNVGRLIASSGSLGLFGTVVRSSGTVSADSATLQGGKIVFRATQRTEISGTVSANGSTGGTIQALGNQVGIMDGATVIANGAQGGGTILIGGDYQGRNPDVPNAQVSYVSPTATISADAARYGSGGKLIVWADNATRAYGRLSARGGINGGNGGFIETSGKQYLDVAGIRVSTVAPNGMTGNWLLDPTDITIVHGIAMGGATFTGTTFNNGGGLTATLNDFDINANLAGSAITITTASAGAGTGNITFDATGGAVVVSTGAGTSLNLQADRDIRFAGGSTTFSGAMNVILTPAGKITTASGSSVNLSGSTIAWLGAAKTWENSGTLNLSGPAQVHLNFNSPPGSASTFHNMSGGIVNVTGTPPGWAFFSNPASQDGIITNDGTFNIIAGTSFEAAYSQSSGGTLNIANGQFLSMQNADVLGGTFNIGTGSSLTLSELHNGARTFSGATINDAGTLSFGNPGTATFSNTTLSYTGGTGDYTIQTGITYTGNVCYSATGNLVVSSPINTTGDVTLNSDSDGVGGGNIQITSSLVSNGGNITLAGGIGGAGLAAGASTVSSAVATGIYLSGASVNAGGGNITMRGTGMAGTSFGADGIYITGNSVVQTSGAGAITLNGTGGAGGVGSSGNSGIRLGTKAQLSSVNGAITLNGQGGAGNNGSNYGVYVHNGAIVTSTGSGTITLNGTGASTGTGNAGVRISGTGGATKISTNGGALGITGIGGAGGDGLQIVSGATVQSTAGTLSLNGASGSGAGVSGVYINVSTVSAGVASVNANSFTLNGGTWNQVSATLPVFNVGDFSIMNGTFIRALGGNGSIATPYLLTDIYGVQGMGSAGMLGNSYVLANNIDASGTVNWNAGAGFAPVGNAMTSFTGTFDGQNHTISNLFINLPTTTDVGLFGYTDTGSAIRNVGLVGGSVNGASSVGGLVGNNGGTWGGLVATVSNSYSSGITVNGQSSVGGLAGDNYGSISNSYSSGGTVNGQSSVGGLVGGNWEAINTSYSTNAVAAGGGGLTGWDEMWYTNNNNYWDIQTSGRTTSGNPNETGLTTAQMKTMSSFAGWNIANTGGAGMTWRIYDGSTTPLLTSFLKPLTVTANAATKTYDGLAYSGGNGVAYSVASPALSGTLGYGGTSQGAVNAGSYVLAPTGLFSNQQGYDISYVNGSLTVNPANLSVTATAASKTYDGVAYSGGNGVSYTGLTNGETSAVLGGTLAYGGTSQGAINAGSYLITPSGLTSGNYAIGYVNGTLTIAAAVPAAAPAAAATPALTTTSFLPDLINTMLIPGNGASGASQSTVSTSQSTIGGINNKKSAAKTVTVNGEILLAGSNEPPLPVCR